MHGNETDQTTELNVHVQRHRQIRIITGKGTRECDVSELEFFPWS